MSKVFWYVIFRKNGWKFFMQFGEKYGMPWAIGKMPRNTPQAKADEMLNNLENMVADAVGVIPDDSSVELLTVQGKNGEGLYRTIIDMLGEEISMAICGQNLTSQVKGGSFAAGKMHFDILTILADDDRKLVEGSLNNLLKMICEVNAIKDIPTLSLIADDEIDNTLSERDERLAKIGVKFTKKYFLKNYGFEEDEIEVVDVSAVKTPAIANFSESPAITAKPFDTIDEEAAAIDTKAAEREIYKLVSDSLQNANSYEEAYVAVLGAYPNTEITSLEQTLVKLIANSQILGVTEVGNE
jgi:phage gp29-like protein